MFNRLLELIKQADAKCQNSKQCEGCIGYGKGADCVNYNIADHLLANGVIVPPCKVGDALWFPSRYHNRPIPFVITRLEFYDEELVMCCEGSIEWKRESIGKTVFLTREEAEKALKGGEGK